MSTSKNSASSLADRLQAVTHHRVNDDFLKMSYDQMSQLRITFGETKLNQKYIEVLETDPKYAQWFARKYAGSQKPAHQSFLYFMNLYVERLVLNQGKVPEARSKSKAKKPETVPSEAGSHASWSDAELAPSWDVMREETSAQLQEEIGMQNQRITNMEHTLTQIVQQLQALTQASLK